MKFLGAQYSESRRGRAEAVRRLLRHLRPRQRGRHRPGAAAGRARRARGAAVHPRPQRAGDGAHRRRVRADEEPAADLRGSTSVGPGATNMVTGAALATINRLPVLLLPADTFADRSASPLLQELELPYAGDVTVNDAFRPVSKYFDRIWRPEQLPSALLVGDAGARPTRPRPARSPSASRRTCRRRRTTGRSSCSRSGSGTSPGRCPSPR